MCIYDSATFCQAGNAIQDLLLTSLRRIGYVWRMWTKCERNVDEMWTKCGRSVDEVWTKCGRNVDEIYTKYI